MELRHGCGERAVFKVFRCAEQGFEHWLDHYVLGEDADGLVNRGSLAEGGFQAFCRLVYLTLHGGILSVDALYSCQDRHIGGVGILRPSVPVLAVTHFFNNGGADLR